jgi:hypothetical protein
MNKRIKQLMGQTLDEKFAGTWSTMDTQDLTKFAERFAELIVRECVHAVMDGSKEGDWYAQKIEEHFDNGQGGILHFGVEE